VSLRSISSVRSAVEAPFAPSRPMRHFIPTEW
jgi:hypothetical protein